MFHRDACLHCLLLAFFLLGHTPRVEAKSESFGSSVQRKVFAIDSRLRSAFLQRATGLDHAQPSVTAAGRRQELRRHFDVVIGTLFANSERNLESALDRLQRRCQEDWTAQERLEWRQRLAKERLVNIRRLQRYRDRGLFPVNEHVAGRAVPVFVDNYDTACAVGHLMRESGWGEQVAQVQATNNLVYVTDASDGPVVDWVSTSGLTQEEAALIQPAYEPPPFNATFQQLMAGGSISHNGLRYENFKMSTGLTLVPTFPPLFIEASPFDASIIGVAARQGSYASPSGPGYAGHFDDWLFIGAPDFFVGGFSSTQDGEAILLSFSFDVVAEQSGKSIAAMTLESNANFNFNIGEDIAVFVIASDPNTSSQLTELGIASNAPDPHFLSGYDEGTFSAREKITVRTLVRLQNEAQFTSLTYSFKAIPEPNSAGLLLIGNLGAVLAVRRVKLRRNICLPGAPLQ